MYIDIDIAELLMLEGLWKSADDRETRLLTQGVPPVRCSSCSALGTPGPQISIRSLPTMICPLKCLP